MTETSKKQRGLVSYLREFVIKASLLVKKCEGQSLFEYALIILFVGITVIIALTIFGFDLQALFQFITNNVFPI